MRTKDTILLEQAYQIVHEAKTPCPCTVGKKCKNEKCTCPACKKSKKNTAAAKGF